MEILLVNDDGIYANGILTLAKDLSKEHKVTVVAPYKQMSGQSHSLTFNNYINFMPLEILDGIDCFAVSGTPCDCVKFGIDILLGRKPDLVVSGINDGFNLGTDVIYSGTVNAALEGLVMGVPAIAVSQTYKWGDYHFASEFVCEHIEKFAELAQADKNSIISINIPSHLVDEKNNVNNIKGVRVGKLGTRKYEDNYEKNGLKGYYLEGAPNIEEETDVNNDTLLIEEGYVTISFVKADYNNYELLAKYGKEFKL
ncbi:MAG: 5'/3'-nucleotidase SurE [Clostridia bacterium]